MRSLAHVSQQVLHDEDPSFSQMSLVRNIFLYASLQSLFNLKCPGRFANQSINHRLKTFNQYDMSEKCSNINKW